MIEFWDNLAPAYIRALPTYQPGKPIEQLERELGIRDAIKIASNENPLGPSPMAVEAARAALAGVHRYPDGGAFYLRRALAERLGVAPDELVFGSGSNEIIYLVVHALCRPGVDEVLTHKYAFLSYRLSALAHRIELVEADVTADLACDPDLLIAAMTPRTKVVFLANPNNPTGSYVPRPALEKILAHLPPRALLVVDEAYHEYAAAAADDYATSQGYRTADEPRIVTLRTFSKIYGLAGLRVGYAVGDRRVIAMLERVRRPFNLNAVAQAAALAALDDRAHVEASRQAAREGIAAICEAARALGLRPYPSLGNFALIGLGRPAEPACDALGRAGVITRPMTAWGLPEHLRISVGSADETRRACDALAAVMGGLPAPR